MRAKPGQQQQQQQPYSLYYQSPIQGSQPQFSVVVDGRQQQQQQQQQSVPGPDLFGDAGIAAPPLAYAAGNPPNRYAPYPPQQQSPPTGTYDLPFDSFDHRMDSLYQPLQPYQRAYGSATQPVGLFGPPATGQQPPQSQGQGGQQQQGKKW